MVIWLINVSDITYILYRHNGIKTWQFSICKSHKTIEERILGLVEKSNGIKERDIVHI